MSGNAKASVASSDPLAGTRFRTLSRLGQGGIGVVYEAEEIGSGRRVAVKLLRAELRDELLPRARHEDQNLKSLSRLEHPNIVQWLDSGWTATGSPFLVMELLKGPTLAKALAERGPFDVSTAIRIVTAVLSGLSAVHRHGIVHRDLKLDNILLHDSGRSSGPVVKILDFGFAKDLQGKTPGIATVLTARGEVIGTPRYMSPEQAMGRSADARSDLYTMGYIFYTLITGRLPFQHLSEPSELLFAHAIHPIELPSALGLRPIAAELDRVVATALAKEPEERFQTATEFAQALIAVENAMRNPVGWMETISFDPDEPRTQQPASLGPDQEAGVALPLEAERFQASQPARASQPAQAPQPARAAQLAQAPQPSQAAQPASSHAFPAGIRARTLIFLIVVVAAGIGFAALIAWAVSKGMEP